MTIEHNTISQLDPWERVIYYIPKVINSIRTILFLEDFDIEREIFERIVGEYKKHDEDIPNFLIDLKNFESYLRNNPNKERVYSKMLSVYVTKKIKMNEIEEMEFEIQNMEIKAKELISISERAKELSKKLIDFNKIQRITNED